MAEDYSQQIAYLESLLASGAESVSVDGTNTKLRSRDEILAEINRLQDLSATTKKRPKLLRMNLNNSF